MPRDDLRLLNAVMRTGAWELGSASFATGQTANNKLDMVKPLRDPKVGPELLRRMAQIVLPYEPDALWGVPNGGQEYAEELSELCGLPLVRLEKIGEGTETEFEFKSDVDAELALESTILAGTEDTVTTLSQTRKALKTRKAFKTHKALKVEPLGEKTKVIIGAFIRGTDLPIVRSSDPFDLRGAIIRPIPAVITEDNPFYKRYAKYDRSTAMEQNTGTAD